MTNGRRTCIQCGADISGRIASAKFCSDYCRGRARYLARRVDGLGFAPCRICGEPTTVRMEFATQRTKHRKCFEHGAVYGYDKHHCRCDDCRAAKAASMREYARRRKAEGRPIRKRGRVDVFCVDCGCMLITGVGKGGGDPRCSECGESRRTTIRSARRRRRRLEELAAKSAQGSSGNPSWPWIQGSCTYCGDQFVRRGGASPYCSKACNRADRRGKWITARARQRIYERDNWTCQLCLEPVEVTESGEYNPWAPSLDHIAPQSHMLLPDHSPENLRTAHVWCNAVRGDGTYHADFFEEAS